MSNVINFIPYLAEKEADEAFKWAFEIREIFGSMRLNQMYRPPATKVYNLHVSNKELVSRLDDLAVALKQNGFPEHADIMWELSDSLLEGPDAA